MFISGEKMRTSRTHQPLTYDLRLPDEAQVDALRLLDASREVVNQVLPILWPYLDEFGSERATAIFRKTEPMAQESWLKRADLLREVSLLTLVRTDL